MVLAKKVFGAAVAMQETSKLIKCFIKWEQAQELAALLTHFRFYWQILRNI